MTDWAEIFAEVEEPGSASDVAEAMRRPLPRHGDVGHLAPSLPAGNVARPGGGRRGSEWSGYDYLLREDGSIVDRPTVDAVVAHWSTTRDLS